MSVLVIVKFQGDTATFRQAVAELEGCGGVKAGELAAAYTTREASSLSRHQAEDLLRAGREHARPVAPERLGSVGPLPEYSGYAKRAGTFSERHHGVPPV